MDIIVRVLIRVRAGNHQDLPVTGVQIQHDGIQPAHSVPDFAGHYLQGQGMYLIAGQIYINVIAAGVLGGGNTPLRIIEELDLVQFLILHLAVHQQPPVGIEAPHILLPGLDADLVPAVSGELIVLAVVDVPGDGLHGFFPVAAADGIVDHLGGVGRRSQVGGIVIGGVKGRVGLVVSLFALQPDQGGGGGGQGGSVRLGIRIGSGCFRLGKGNILQRNIGLYAAEGQGMCPRLQIEDQRIVEQTVHIL